jgi:hypothetical protein
MASCNSATVDHADSGKWPRATPPLSTMPTQANRRNSFEKCSGGKQSIKLGSNHRPSMHDTRAHAKGPPPGFPIPRYANIVNSPSAHLMLDAASTQARVHTNTIHTVAIASPTPVGDTPAREGMVGASQQKAHILQAALTLGGEHAFITPFVTRTRAGSGGEHHDPALHDHTLAQTAATAAAHPSRSLIIQNLGTIYNPEAHALLRFQFGNFVEHTQSHMSHFVSLMSIQHADM